MYLVFTRMPGESYRRRLRSLLLYLCYVFRALINSLVCWFYTSALGLVLFQIRRKERKKQSDCMANPTLQTQICQTWKLLLFHRVTSFIILKIVTLFGNAQLLKKIKKLTNRVLRVPPAFHISNWANLATAAVTGGKPNQHSPRHQNYLQILTTCIQPWSDHHRQQISTNTVRHK